MKYTLVIILAVLALIINFTPKLIIKKIFKKETDEIGNNAILAVKFFAAIIAVLDFILAVAWL